MNPNKCPVCGSEQFEVETEKGSHPHRKPRFRIVCKQGGDHFHGDWRPTEDDAWANMVWQLQCRERVK